MQYERASLFTSLDTSAAFVWFSWKSYHFFRCPCGSRPTVDGTPKAMLSISKSSKPSVVTVVILKMSGLSRERAAVDCICGSFCGLWVQFYDVSSLENLVEMAIAFICHCLGKQAAQTTFKSVGSRQDKSFAGLPTHRSRTTSVPDTLDILFGLWRGLGNRPFRCNFCSRITTSVPLQQNKFATKDSWHCRIYKNHALNKKCRPHDKLTSLFSCSGTSWMICSRISIDCGALAFEKKGILTRNVGYPLLIFIYFAPGDHNF